MDILSGPEGLSVLLHSSASQEGKEAREAPGWVRASHPCSEWSLGCPSLPLTAASFLLHQPRSCGQPPSPRLPMDPSSPEPAAKEAEPSGPPPDTLGVRLRRRRPPAGRGTSSADSSSSRTFSPAARKRRGPRGSAPGEPPEAPGPPDRVEAEDGGGVLLIDAQGVPYTVPQAGEEGGGPRARRAPHFCPVCLRAFPYLSDLERHSISHSELKPHTCPACGKAFKRASHLRRHRNIHAGLRPFHCALCPRRFREAGELAHHGRVHSGERPYQCPICRLRFTEGNTLRRHARRKHPPPPDSPSSLAGPGMDPPWLEAMAPELELSPGPDPAPGVPEEGPKKSPSPEPTSADLEGPEEGPKRPPTPHTSQATPEDVGAAPE
ncbi:zinc finger protein 524-like [Gracilinanus agilis]|uniref:zinc finger protein 524-like n=1 Tax=Gracilinanus agilis TaxID=191870 RepID=UPI001CFC9808|nr:zinc finger protein 524-like [Gracilinanus agilis]